MWTQVADVVLATTLRYRRLALKYHPDINKDAAANDEFLRICEAYEVLIDREWCLHFQCCWLCKECHSHQLAAGSNAAGMLRNRLGCNG